MDYDPDAFKKCTTCLAIRSDARKRGKDGLEASYWKPLIGHVPDDVILDMAIAEIHAIHHCDQQAFGDAVVFAGIAVLVAYYSRTEVVPREEMNNRLSTQFSQMRAQIDETTRTARAEAEAVCKADMDEYRVRVANVAALLHFAGKRKTMRTEEVNAALNWHRGEEIPQATIDHQRSMRELVNHSRGGIIGQ
jgi:hypothetical protein